jgi:hypothetical protein
MDYPAVLYDKQTPPKTLAVLFGVAIISYPGSGVK